MTREDLMTVSQRCHTLQGLQREVDRQLRQLERELQTRNTEVSKLEEKNLQNLVNAIIGRQSKLLHEKRLEVYMLEKKQEEIRQRREAVAEEIAGCQILLGQPMDEESRKALEICRLQNQGRDMAEALRRGKKARELCKGLRTVLEQAQEYGYLDARSGSYAVHDAKLDDVQTMVTYLREQMEEFEFALEALGLKQDGEDLPEIKRCLYDGLILDWIVLKRIGDALDRVKNVGRYISETVWKLERQQKENQQEMEGLK